MKNSLPTDLPDNSPEAMIKRMTLIHFAILASIVIFAGISFYLVRTGREVIPELHDTFKIIVPLIAVACAFTSRFVYTMLVRKAIAAEGGKRITAYQTALLVRLAILEAPCLLSIVSYLLTGNPFYLTVAAALLVLMILFKPTLFRYKEEIESASF